MFASTTSPRVLSFYNFAFKHGAILYPNLSLPITIIHLACDCLINNKNRSGVLYSREPPPLHCELLRERQLIVFSTKARYYRIYKIYTSIFSVYSMYKYTTV